MKGKRATIWVAASVSSSDTIAAMAVPLRWPPIDFSSRLEFCGISLVTNSPARFI
ncbi:secreted protein [gut metagenome]|uniref:Secreted protein n=1 Tax=gut metagenome TaxID=749906 RepID=J9FCD2_9ZZZZ